MIYLDHAATTPVRPEVTESMRPYSSEWFGNPSGSHAAGRAARRALDDARERLAAVLGCEPGELVFTSGGTEADNLAVTGAALHAVSRGAAAPLACCSAVEHPAVLEPTRWLGGAVLAVERTGRLDLARASELIESEAERLGLVSLMLANNETGLLQPLVPLATLVRAKAPNALLHTDAVQALAWLEVASETAEADLVSYSAHKIGGPKGVGALVARRGARQRLAPILRGGPQERELRAGTPNVAGIVGFACAAELAARDRARAASSVEALSRRLADGLSAALADVVVPSASFDRLPNIVNVGFPGVESEELLVLLDERGVAASAGSSCASGALEPSHVLLAMGVRADMAASHVRFSLGPETTESEIDRAIEITSGVVETLRAA